MNDQYLKSLLSEGNQVSQGKIAQAEEYAMVSGIPLYSALISQDFISKQDLGLLIAKSFNLSYVDLETRNVLQSVVKKIPQDVAKKNRIILIEEAEGRVTIATDVPVGKGLAGAIHALYPSANVVLVYALPDDINAAMSLYRDPIDKRLADVVNSGKDVSSQIFSELIDEALLRKASDIHIEPRKSDVLIRFRVDGVLQEVISLSKDFLDPLVNLIKVKANLRLDQHGESQDGRISYAEGGRDVDMRVSTLPTLSGEKIVFRILSTYARYFALKELGLEDNDLKALVEALKRPYGMLLVTGPTGSGKTTTLYSIIHILNKPEINITTIEDPIEYEVVGVNQVQVNNRTDMTFDKGLRSIVRQDPNVILVGEIRDLETVSVAVNAALTGHLLLSTFHANDTTSAIPRLMDLGVQPFLIAATLNMVVTQRLVRLICPKCKQSVSFTKADIEVIAPGAGKYFDSDTITCYRGRGCEDCGNTGYKGRQAIFEIIAITPEIQDLILTKPSARQIRALTIKSGYKSLFENGVKKVLAGVTTIEELARVAAVPENINMA